MTGGDGPLAWGRRQPAAGAAWAAGRGRRAALGLALALLLASCQVVTPPPSPTTAPPLVPTATSAAAPTPLSPTAPPPTVPPSPPTPTGVTGTATATAPAAPSPTARLASPPVFQFPPTPVPPTPYGGASVGLGQPFALKMGQAVTVQGDDLRLEFTAITEDSRCPADVNCAWSGRAVVALAATFPTQTARPLTIATCCPFDQANRLVHVGHQLRLLRVLPAPLRHEVKIKPEEYVIELIVTRAAG